jgi:hypothetical protein
LASKISLTVLIACSSSMSDQAENASLACSMEHEHNLTVILPHTDEPLEGYLRVYANDPFGNRLELMEPRSAR